VVAACLVALALTCPHGLDESGYLGVADRLQASVERMWDPAEGRYAAGGGGVETTTNANLLVAHSVAALLGHRGPSRRDGRARKLVRALLSSPPYAATLPPRIGTDSQWHAPGWVSSMHHLRSGQHVMVDSEVVDGLAYAWLARHRLKLSPVLRQRLVRTVHAVAMSRFWRWPAIRLNQFNWYARIYTADALVTGRSWLVRHDLRRQIVRFTRSRRNLGPGLRFHYSPQTPDAAPLNVDSAEYANIVASFTRFGAPVPRESRGLLRRWLRRVLAGYWTHSGYLNWDTGYGFRRWHQSKKLGLSQQALIGIASARALAGRRTRGWAKWILDRGFAFFDTQTRRAGGLAPGVFFGVHVRPQSTGSARLGAARMEANAARAAQAGLGARRARRPPPLYAFDPDTGRLAITTPRYNTAVVPVSQHAFPYGGIELARLYDSRQEVAASIGGVPPAAFGLVVRDRAGHRVLSTQRPRRRLGGRPLRLTRAPAGVAASLTARRAYAGAFRDLRATGTVRAGRVLARTTHRFTARSIETRWSLRGARRDAAVVEFPSWGPSAAIVAVGRDGSRFTLGGRRVALARIKRLHVHSSHSGYTIRPRRRPRGATVRVLHPRRQSSAPHPGPTLVVGILRPGARGSARFAVRLTVDG
jgi:hypothetical protein